MSRIFSVVFFTTITLVIAEIFVHVIILESMSSKRISSREATESRTSKYDVDQQAKFSIVARRPFCDKPRGIVYVKVHKTGSEALYRALYKRAIKDKQVVLKPAPYPNIGGYPGHVKTRFMYQLGPKGSLKAAEYSSRVFLINHCRFNASLLWQFFPKNTPFVSVIRKPWEQFQSSFYYYYSMLPKSSVSSNCFFYPYFHIARGRSMNLLTYLHTASSELNESVPWYFRSKNYQSHDLGLDPMLEDDQQIDREIGKLAPYIDLMLITDYMEESLILLKETLCLDWSDILLENDGTSHRYESYDVEQDPAALKVFNRMYKLDIALYDFFNASFWEKVNVYGRGRMAEDVTKLRKLKVEYSRNSTRRTRPKRQLPEFDKSDVYRAALENYNSIAMTNILRQKLKKETKLSQDEIDQLSKYMVANGGGCPI